jgi:hypothetical protein
MSTLFASDLDRTLIYSKGALARAAGHDASRLVCVETHDGKQSSWMTRETADTLGGLHENGLLVPVTTRIDEQYRRVRLIGPMPRFAITTNGGEILIDGVADKAWSRQVSGTLKQAYPLEAVWEQASHVCHPDFTAKLRNADGRFCYAVIKPKHLPASFVEDVSGWAAERGWRISLQGRKLYWVPETLTKSAAVAEVARRVGATVVLAAGDSLLDTDMLLAADRGIHPRHGELFEQGWSAAGVECTRAAGVLAGQEIAAWFASQVTRSP